MPTVEFQSSTATWCGAGSRGRSWLSVARTSSAGPSVTPSRPAWS